MRSKYASKLLNNCLFKMEQINALGIIYLSLCTCIFKPVCDFDETPPLKTWLNAGNSRGLIEISMFIHVM